MILTWNEMGTRERLFAALKSLLTGGSIEDARVDAVYNPRTDRVHFDRHERTASRTTIGSKVACEGSESVAEIRNIFPMLFTSDQAVLNSVAIEGEKRCELGCGEAPHPGKPCG